MSIRTITGAALANFGGLAKNWRGEVVALLVADHECADEKGRRVGGVAQLIQLTDPAQVGVMLYACRSGVRYGATPTRLSGVRPDLDAAILLATSVIEAQGKRYVDKYIVRAKVTT